MSGHEVIDEAVVARAGALARARYATGANCAESVLHALPEALGDESLRLPTAIGTGWTAGIGQGGCLCGALAAGVMLTGAQIDAQPGAPAAGRARSVEASGALRDAFKEEFGSTCCRVLRRGMEPASAECRAHCSEITGRTAEMVAARLLRSAAEPVPAARLIAGRDLAAAAAPTLGLAAVALAGFGAAIVLTGARVSGGTVAIVIVSSVVLAAILTLVRMIRPGRSGARKAGAS